MADTMTLEEVHEEMLPHVDGTDTHTKVPVVKMQGWADAIYAAIKKREHDTKVCVWSEDEDGNWDTGCGNMFVLTEGTPYDNEMGFCCYCGHKLDQVTQENAAMAQESGNG